jgi:N-acetylglutamate synthase-like GNAT family acetyltransferase
MMPCFLKRKNAAHLVLLLVVAFLHTVDSYSIRAATPQEVTSARKILFQQAMNPFALSAETLLVASADSDGTNDLLGFGQIRTLDEQYSELASLYVQPDRRNEKIGSAIVQALLDQHYADEHHSKLCLLTLKPTIKFYEPFGFRVANEAERKMLPKAIQLEFKAGNALSFVLGNELVCMVEQM